MRKFIITVLSVLITAAAWSQPALYNDGALYIGTGAQMYVNGNFTNTSSGTIANNGTLVLTGNLTNAATMNNATGGTLQLSGSTAQVIGGIAPFYATHVLLNNSAGFTLTQPFKANGLITFGSGVVSAPTIGSSLQLASSGDVTGASDGSHVDGYVIKEGTGSFTFPIGTSVKYQPVRVNLSSNTAGMRANYYPGNGGAQPLIGITSYNTGELWNLIPAGTATGTVTMYWDAFKPISLSSAQEARVAHNSGSTWDNEGGNNITGDASSGSVTSNIVSTFGPFTTGTACATPVMNAVGNQAVCAGANTSAVTFSGATSYTWTNSNTGIGLSSGGAGNLPSFAGINPGNTPAVATITVTPSDPVCGIGTPQTFTITVNPMSATQVAAQQYCSAQLPVSWNGLTITGSGTYTAHLTNRYGCDSAVTSVFNIINTVTPSVSITASSTSQCGTAPITFQATGINARSEATAPAQYQWYKNGNPISGATSASYTENSPADNNSYYVSLHSLLPCVTQANVTSNTILIRVYTATSSTTNVSACAEQLPYSWNGQSYSTAGQYLVHLTNAHGCDSAATLNLTVAVCTQAAVGYPGSPYCGSATTATPVFTAVSGGVFSAVPAGLSLNTTTGVVDIAASASGTYTVSYGVAGNMATATVIIRPTSVISLISNMNLCANTATGLIDFQPLPGISTSWTNDNVSIGLAASGTGNIPSFTLQNASASISTAIIQVTPVSGSCKFAPMVFRINVKPLPQITSVPANQVLCANRTASASVLMSPTAGASINWTNTNSAIGIGTVGSGTVVSFTTMNNTSTPQTGNFSAVATMAGCAGSPVTFAITTHPNIDSVVYPGNPFCQAGSVSPLYFGSKGGSFSSSPAGLTINATTGVIALGQSTPGTYTITYTVNASNGCNPTVTRVITIRAQAGASPEPNQIWCNGALVPSLAWTGPNVPFTWTNDNPSIGLPASGVGSLPAFTAVNPGPTARVAYIRANAQPTGGSVYCPGKVMQFRITVNAPNTSGCGPVAQHGDAGGADGTSRTAPLVSISPNPATSISTVTMPESGNYTLQLLNRLGAAAGAVRTFSGSRTSIDLTGLTPGSYTVRIVNNRTGQVSQQQLIRL